MFRLKVENPEEAIARYNGWLTIFTGILAGFTAVLAIATVALGAMNFFQLKLARAEFASSHRPKIRIKHVWLVTLGSNQAFCRVYKPSARPIDGMGRFVKSYYSDPDYEYED